MARIRTIKPHFWEDAGVGSLTREARLTFIALWTFADDLGVVVANPVWLKTRIYPYDTIQLRVFKGWLDELLQNGFISLLSYRDERFYYLPSFVRHQLINRPNKDDVNLPVEVLNNLVGIENQSLAIGGSEITDSSLTRVGEDRIGKEEEVKEEERDYLTFCC